MTRFRRIRKWGNSFVLIFSSADVKDYRIDETMEADIEDIQLRKEVKK